jgi:type I restriction enzyme S subunit
MEKSRMADPTCDRSVPTQEWVGCRFKPYPAYKDSGVEWLGEIPAHWSCVALSRVTSSRCDGPFGSGLKSEHYANDGVRVVRLQNIGEAAFLDEDHVYIDHQYAKELGDHTIIAGDLLIAGLGDEGHPVGRACVAPDGVEPAMVKADCFRFRLRLNLLLAGFAAHQLSATAAAAAAFATGATRSRINLTTTATRKMAVPPIDEQRAIAAFLDRETAKIDGLVAKKERLIELLQEKRSALITRAVNKGLPAEAAAKAGLDPKVPMKDSGVQWLGGIPAHWEIKRLWHLTPSGRRIMYGIVLPGPNVENGVPIVKGGDVSADGLHLDRLNRTTFEIESGYIRSRLRGGDLVYAIRGSIGEVAVVPDELEDANLTQDAARIAYTSATWGPWLLYALKSAAVFAQLESGALGATIRGVNIRDLKRASIPIPPRGEQKQIAKFLERETAKIDVLLREVRSAIDRLKELRGALMSAAVTGKIDVREQLGTAALR